VISIK